MPRGIATQGTRAKLTTGEGDEPYPLRHLLKLAEATRKPSMHRTDHLLIGAGLHRKGTRPKLSTP
jgi:hypothetical protein